MTIAGNSPPGRYGGRYALAAPVDISAHRYLACQLQWTLAVTSDVETRENGGWSIVIYDSSGNWVRYLLNYYGSPANFPNGTTNSNDGTWMNYQAIDNDRCVDYTIDLQLTPEESSGSIDFSQIAGYEVHAGVRVQKTGAEAIQVLRVAAFSQPVIKNGDVTTPITCARIFPLFNASWTATTAPYRNYKQLRPAPQIYWGNPRQTYAARFGFDIGDGSTLTRFDDAVFALTIAPTVDTQYAYYPAQQFADNPKFRVNQSASDYFSANSFVISGVAVDGGELDFYVIGDANATCLLTNGIFYGCGIVDIGHGTIDTVQFDKCSEVVYHADATYTNCQITGNTWSGSRGLTINAAPGDYSAVDIYFADNTGGHDVEITPTSTGTFDLSGLSVKTGQSLKIHNTTATAITVKLAAGVTATTSGSGAITLEYPVTLANASITNLVAGSRVRIYNQTTATELYNDFVAGTAYSADYVDGTDYSAGDIISIRIAWMSGTSAKLPVEYLTVATVNGWSVLSNQHDDTVYNTNAIDGSTITEFTPDYRNVEIDVNDPDGTTTPQRCYAWYIAGQMTADGITNYHGAITAEDEFNYRVNVGVVSLHGKNINTNPLLVVGARIYRSDGAALFVPGNGPVQMEYGRVYALETGTSGLTASESAALLAIPTNPLLVNDVRLNNLDTTVSSRLASSSYTAPDNAGIAASIAALNDLSAADVQTLLNSLPAAILSAATTAPIAANVKQVNSIAIDGTGTEADPWGPV